MITAWFILKMKKIYCYGFLCQAVVKLQKYSKNYLRGKFKDVKINLALLRTMEGHV